MMALLEVLTMEVTTLYGNLLKVPAPSSLRIWRALLMH